jgi:hypothetical protein
LWIAAHNDAESVLAQAGVKLGDEPGDRFGKPVGELLDIGRALESNIRLNGKRDEPTVTCRRALTELGKLADRAAGQRRQTISRESILLRRLRALWRRRPGHRDASRDLDDPLDAAAPSPLLDQLHEARLLELTNVIGHSLPTHAQHRRD